jgi:hypothetical protein
MGEYVVIEPGHVRIDAVGWVARRTGEEYVELTDLLQEGGRLEPLRSWVGWDWMTRAELWCQDREYPVAEGFPLTHDHPWLSAEVSVLLATAAPAGAAAIVSIDGLAPRVYADITTDVGYWYEAGSVQVVCPNEHRWTWGEGDLLTDDDEAIDPATLFDHHPAVGRDDRETDDEGVDDEPDLDDGNRIYCARRDELCDVRLADVATFPQRQRFTVPLSDAAEYRGTGPRHGADDAEQITRDMITAGVLDTNADTLTVIDLDREFSAVPATEVCWRCGVDPGRAHPGCRHPAPGHTDDAGGPPRLLDIAATGALAAQEVGIRHDGRSATARLGVRRPGRVESTLLQAGRHSNVTYHSLRRVVSDALIIMATGAWLYYAGYLIRVARILSIGRLHLRARRQRHEDTAESHHLVDGSGLCRWVEQVGKDVTGGNRHEYLPGRAQVSGGSR